jgi:putative Mg2+ transporter-C (MgtC) family protein
MTINIEIVVKLLLAILVGGVIGLERELHHKAAGFRTIILICVGATLFTLWDIQVGASGRIAANVATGVGFLGAGVILHEANRIRGLTTAAAVWLSAALGMGIGLGAYLTTLITAGLVLVIMRVFAQLEEGLDRLWERRQYQIEFPCRLEKVAEIETRLRQCGLKPGSLQQTKREGQMVCTWNVTGSTAKQDQFVHLMLVDNEVVRLEW